MVRHIADETAVMYLGTMVEYGPTEEVYGHPAHPYTKALLRSVPGIMDRRDRVLESIEGMVPEQYDMITGCRFADRCPYRRDICGRPQTDRMIRHSHLVRCCRAGEVESDAGK